ncbi:hypothetical protein HDU76_000624 [Blyttiomyces sp. JEL0837]|nr:hypothetical protein HDU76_000624 [Blyttiomyces sp. JEL0837]
MNGYSVKVEHAASKQRIKIDVDGSSTLKDFQLEIATEMYLEPSTISLFYMDSGFLVKIKGDRSFREALTETTLFTVEGTTVSTLEHVALSDSSDRSIVIRVTYENILYAIEINSPSLDELNKQLCKQFAWNSTELESMVLIHNSTAIINEPIFIKTLTACDEAKTEPEFILQPKPLSSKPSTELSTLTVPPVSVTVKSPDSAVVHETFDVMLSYEWTSGKAIVKRIKEELELRGLKVWFDEEQMHSNIYERMAEAIFRSSVVSPLLTVPYTKSANCKRELSFAADLKKTLQPTRSVAPNEKLELWAEFVTAGLTYYDFHNSLSDDLKFQKSLGALYSAIATSLNKNIQNVVDEYDTKIQQPENPFLKWLQPIDFKDDVKKFKGDYVAGTRMWAVEQVHQWLHEGNSNLLWLNGGAGLGKSIIAYLISENLPPSYILGSLFFCKHDDINKNSAKRIISTMAFQIASKLPDFHAFLLNEMEEDHAKGDQSRNEFLNLIRNEVENLPGWVKVFTTSRPEMDIYEVLNGVKSSVILTQESNNVIDILVFVRYQLSKYLSVEEGMDSDKLNHVVNHIAEKSSGVFHYARLACKSLTDSSHLCWDGVIENANRFDGGLDQIYLQVLENVFMEVDGEVTERFRKVLGAVTTARVPIQQEAIARLVGLTVGEVGGIILRIQSILSFSNGEIKVLHKSLKDFLSSKERCKNPTYYIEAISFEPIMTTSCLQVMTAELSHNMANLPHETMPLYSAELATQIQWAAGKLAEFKNGRSVWRYGTTEQLLNDAARFIWRFEGSISQNSLHIYSVVVAFMPKSTKLYQTYGSLYASKSVKILPPEMEWSSDLKYIVGHKQGVSGLSFTNDGT